MTSRRITSPPSELTLDSELCKSIKALWDCRYGILLAKRGTGLSLKLTTKALTEYWSCLTLLTKNRFWTSTGGWRKFRTIVVQTSVWLFWPTNLMLVRRGLIAKSKIMTSTTMKMTIKKEKLRWLTRTLPHLNKPIILKFWKPVLNKEQVWMNPSWRWPKL
jgi:hypothetical protein